MLMIEEKDIPIGIKLISLLYYISGVLMLINFIVLLLVEEVFRNELLTSAYFRFFEFQGLINFVLFGVFGFFLFGFFLSIFQPIAGGFLVYIGRGLLKKRKGARNVCITLSIIGIVSLFMFMPFLPNKFHLLIIPASLVNSVIVVYLIFSKNVKKYFNKV